MSKYYKVLIKKFQEKNPNLDFGNGEEWLFNRLQEWSEPLVENSLVTKTEISKVERGLKRLIEIFGKDFFQLSHGNIIGDHILWEGKGKPYLLDLALAPRTGKYYNFLRSIDWLFLKKDLSFNYLKESLEFYGFFENWELEKYIFAFRCIGILGQDVLNLGDNAGFSLERHKEIFLPFIKLEV